MRLIFYLTIFCLILHTVWSSEQTEQSPEKLKTTDEILGNRYAFLLFEDIETCKVVYQQEFILVEKLKKLRKSLMETKENLKLQKSEVTNAQTGTKMGTK